MFASALYSYSPAVLTLGRKAYPNTRVTSSENPREYYLATSYLSVRDGVLVERVTVLSLSPIFKVGRCVFTFHGVSLNGDAMTGARGIGINICETLLGTCFTGFLGLKGHKTVYIGMVVVTSLTVNVLTFSHCLECKVDQTLGRWGTRWNVELGQHSGEDVIAVPDARLGSVLEPNRTLLS